jgi:hypothetical protein
MYADIMRGGMMSAPATLINPLLIFCSIFHAHQLMIWRSRCVPIRTAAEIKATIVLPPLQSVKLYHKLAQEVMELRVLGMGFAAIAKSFKVCENTARRAANYNKRQK